MMQWIKYRGGLRLVAEAASASQLVTKCMAPQWTVSCCLQRAGLATIAGTPRAVYRRPRADAEDDEPVFEGKSAKMVAALAQSDGLSNGTDLRGPHAWYPEARAMKRKVVLHVGPTNSGKTHQALQRLKEAKTGMYCGPLRLLAWEISERLNNESTTATRLLSYSHTLLSDVPCNLMTGQELEEREGANHLSCTVEMADTMKRWDVAVLDEIQMIGSEDRGWAWTRAILGLQADEIHACGDLSAVSIIERLLAFTGDELEVRQYERLSPVTVQRTSLQSLDAIQPGDCVVCFGRKRMFDIKRQIELQTGLKVGVIYGSLPPPTRKQQAQMFNQAVGGTDVLVATDAVGMGLNLGIRRVIFQSLEKFDGRQTRRLTVSEVKQIGGRAGRYGSRFPVGHLTAFRPGDVVAIERAMKLPTPKITAACLFPTLESLETFTRTTNQSVFEAMMANEANASSSDDDEFSDDAELMRDSDDEDADEDSDSQEDDNEDADDDDDDADDDNDDDGRELLAGSEKLFEDDPDDFDELNMPVPFSIVLKTFLKSAQLDRKLYFVRDCRALIKAARALDHVELSLADRFAFCMAPCDKPVELMALKRYARAYASGGLVAPSIAPSKGVPRSLGQLQLAEDKHAILDLYLWLARKFPNSFTQAERAREHMTKLEELIAAGLAYLGKEATNRFESRYHQSHGKKHKAGKPKKVRGKGRRDDRD